MATVWIRLSQLVERVIAQRLPAAGAPPSPPATSSPAASLGDRTPEQNVPVTDRLVIQVMTRMRTLAREEWFRAGRLR
jgi:hypothetical protein